MFNRFKIKWNETKETEKLTCDITVEVFEAIGFPFVRSYKFVGFVEKHSIGFNGDLPEFTETERLALNNSMWARWKAFNGETEDCFWV